MKAISLGLRSTRVTLAILVFLAVFCGLAAWSTGSVQNATAGGAASVLGLQRPFQSWPFLLACGFLFANTLACTVHRAVRVAAPWRGSLPPAAVALPRRAEADVVRFLVTAHGFRPGNDALFRNRHALWAGFIFHVALLVLMAGVAVQQAFHDSGAFEVAEGETVDLAEAGTVFARERGPLAPATPPALRVTLLAFDLFLHQRGYAPDRGSHLQVERPGSPPSQAFVDRAHGLAAGSVTIFQAIPAGLTLLVELPGLGVRAFHLRGDTTTAASAAFTSPGGTALRLGVRASRPLNDPAGTGPLTIWEAHGGAPTELESDAAFPFGEGTARLVGVTRWAGFTFSRSPGMPAVYAGFALLVLGATLLAFPAGVARLAGDDAEVAGWVWVNRGHEALLAEWQEFADNRPVGRGEKP